MKYLAYPEFTALANTLSGRDVGAVTLAARVEAYSFKPVGEDRKLAREVQEKFAGETAASTTASTNTSPNGGALPAPIVLGAHTSSSASGGGGSVADNTGMAPELLPPPSFRPILRGESWESMGGVSSGRDEGDDMEYRPDPLRNLSVTRVRSDSVTLSSDVNGGSSVGGINTRTYACLVATLNSSFPDYDFSSLPRDAFRRMPDIAEAVSNVNNQLTELAQLEAREPKLAQELNFAAYSVQTLAAPHTPVTPPTPQPASAGLSRADSTGHISAAGSTARHAGGRSRAGSVSGADAASGGTGAGGADASAVPMPPTWRPTLHRKGSAPNNSVSGADEGHASAAVHGSTPAPAAAAHTSSVASAGSHASMPRERAGSVSARQPSTAQSSSSASTLSTSVAGQVPDTPAGYILQRLSKVPGGYGMSFMEALWLILNDVITLSACEVYTYTPIWDTDPLIVGALWSFNYFFVNRQRKKLVFFSCTARSTISRLAVVAPVRPIAPSPPPDVTNMASQDVPSASPTNTESGTEQEEMHHSSADVATAQVTGRKRRATREAADTADMPEPAHTRRFSGEHASTSDVA